MTIREDLLKLDQNLKSHIDAMQQARANIAKTLSLIDQKPPQPVAAARKKPAAPAKPTAAVKPAANGDNWGRLKALLAENGKPMHADEIATRLNLTRTAIAYHIHHHRKELKLAGSGTASKWALAKS